MSDSDLTPETRAFADMMHVGNADLMLRLSNLVSIGQDKIPSPHRLAMIAALRMRHTTMPAGREISPSMQTSLERALIQARLHLMRTPGAAEGFRVAATQYEVEFATRRGQAQTHLDNLGADGISALGAIEWCQRLITKFTAQEIARPNLADYSRQLGAIHDRLTRFDPSVGEVLRCTMALLSLGNDVSAKSMDRVRQNLPDFAMNMPEAYAQPYRQAASN